MRLVLGLVLLLSTLAPSDHWWLEDYGFSDLALDGSGVVVAVIEKGVDD